MNWISVKDRIPNEREWVLVVVQGKIQTIKSHPPIDLSYCYKYTNEDPLMWTCNGNVTHWMPLPNLPE